MQPGEQSWLRVWACPLLLAGVALGFDAADRTVPFGLLSTGPLDEVAHLATAALGLMVLVCFIDAPRRFYAAALVASVAIDLDHIPLYLGLLADRDQRPVTHSLATVVVFASAAAASRRHRAVLAGAATGLVLHFGRDLAEGPPGVRILWPVQQTAWTASYWWFLGMIIVFTAARLILVTTCVPRTRVRLFQPPSPSRSAAHAQLHCMNLGDPFPDREPEASDSEGGGRNRLSRPHLPAGAVAAVTASSGGPAAAQDSTATTAGTHTKHNHCPAGSAGEHHGHDGSCTGGDDAPTSCRKPSTLNATLRRPWDSPGPEVGGAMLGICGSAGGQCIFPGVARPFHCR